MKSQSWKRMEGRRRELDQESARVRNRVRRLAMERALMILGSWVIGLGLMGLRWKAACRSEREVRWLPVVRIRRPVFHSFRDMSEFSGLNWQTAG